MDTITTINELKNLVETFTKDRDWDRSLCPKTIAIYLSLEASELLEKFTFVDNEQSKGHFHKKRNEIEQELSDILYWVLQMTWMHDIDLSTAFKQKLDMNKQKYPIEKAKGNTAKYTDIQGSN